MSVTDATNRSGAARSLTNIYDPYFAQRKYEEKRTSSRSDVNLTKHQALELDTVLSEKGL